VIAGVSGFVLRLASALAVVAVETAVVATSATLTSAVTPTDRRTLKRLRIARPALSTVRLTTTLGSRRARARGGTGHPGYCAGSFVSADRSTA
jgi:hypothetical protein